MVTKKEVELKPGEVKVENDKEIKAAMDRHNSLMELMNAAEKSEGFCIGATILNQGRLQHFFIKTSFPNDDILRSIKHVKEMAICELEKDIQ